jgi:hypothetical protein
MNARIFLLRVAVPLLLNLDPEFYQHTIKTRQDQAKQYLQRVQSRFKHSTIDFETRVLIQALNLAESMSAELLILAKSSAMQRLIQSLRDRHNFYAVTDATKPQPFQESSQTFIKDESVSVSIHILNSLSAEDIFEFADRQQVDLIALLSHRSLGIGQWLFRGTIEKVTHGAKYVTLIFQEKKALK